MAKKKIRAASPAPAPARVEPAWDKKTWMSLANVRLGVAPFIVAGALHAKPDNAKMTEAEVRVCLHEFLSQSR